MKVSINKSKALGSVTAPPSKSLAHRYLICAALSDGVSVIKNVDLSEDIKASIDCIKALGALVSLDGSTVKVTGINNIPFDKTIEFNCRESGSTMRFFMGLSMYFGLPSKFYGSETLRKRPFSVYEDICRDQNIEFVKNSDHIYINGEISSGNFKIPGNISSQFITGLLFVLPLLYENSKIELIPPVESKSYLDLTLQAMKAFGVEALWESENVLFVKGNQAYKPTEIKVEGDESNAAFLEAFNLIGGNVNVLGLNPETLQGDRVYRSYFFELKDGCPTLDISDCPDLGPVLFTMAACCNGAVFTGTRRLKMKESDRGRVMCEELSKFNVETKMDENSIEIVKSDLQKPNEAIDGHNDHRIVMSMALLASLTGADIEGTEACKKSYPGFFKDIKSLGIEVETDGMDW